MYAHMPIIRDILFGAASNGARLATMCKALNISAELLNDSNQFLDFERSMEAWQVAVKETGDPLLGLHLGEKTNPTILGLIGHLMQSSPTLITAFQSVCTHSQLATDMFFYKWHQSKKEITLSFEAHEVWKNTSPKTAKQATEQAMAGTMNVFRLLCGKTIVPKRATFNFPKPISRKEYERIFLCDVQFEAELNTLVFDAALLEIPVISYDSSLYALLQQLVHDRIETVLKRKSGFADRVVAILMQEFKTQVPALEVMASRLNMTARTFQRKLHEENVTYRTLSIRLQKDIALHLVRNSSNKIEEIAYLMGYSEARAFRRAFKSWTGKLPSQVKRSD